MLINQPSSPRPRFHLLAEPQDIILQSNQLACPVIVVKTGGGPFFFLFAAGRAYYFYCACPITVTVPVLKNVLFS
ncbi:hypothetical protein [Kistimonas scapharcae]|uniref:hypothetical protein n=1 Tax=Kistimonas scapharcae TaxID=1036133 RepID=UPI0031E99081